ncbi:MAG: alpha-L-fucosidase [Planctomycetota bacterium]
MRAVVVVMLLVSACAANMVLEAAVNESPDPYAHETREQRDERLAWFNDARFGMFIHWGVYSVPAGKYKGREIPHDSCFITERTKMPLTDYHAFAAQFNPTQYDPDAWVRLARDAGMKYIVITTKHHDGFALFETKASKWNMVDATPYGKDVIAPLAEACRKYGMKIGFYYSQCEDWGNPGGRVRKGKWDPLQEGEFMDYIHNIAVPQVRELLTNYGDVSVFWWDTPTKMTQEASDALIQQLKLQPGIIHNNRLGFYNGDLRTPEQHIPSAEDGHAWEACMTIRDGWGFKLSDTNFKSTKTLIHNLIDIASKGGNYLLNVGPTSEGLIPATSQERLRGIGEWMQVNGDSIYGTQASLFARPAWGRVTRKSVPEGAILYLHVFDWKQDGTLFIPVGNEVLSCALFNDREQTFEVERNAEGLTVTMQGAAPNPIASVIELRLKGEQVLTGENMIRQQKNGTVFLGAEQASFGGGGRIGIDHALRAIKNWRLEKAWASWSFTLKQAGTYRIELDAATSGETALTITVDGTKVPVAMPKTKDLYDFEKMSAGQVDLEHPGEVTLRVDPVPGKWNRINLRSVRLLPIGEMK